METTIRPSFNTTKAPVRSPWGVWAMLLLCLAGISGWAQTVYIGMGTGSSTSYPVATISNYSATECVYLSSEIGAGNADKNITKVAYYKSSTSGASTTPIAIKIYMKTTAQTGVNNSTSSTTSYTIGSGFADYTLVFDGNLPNDAGEGLREVTLDVPFYYASGNLSVLVTGSTLISSGRPSFRISAPGTPYKRSSYSNATTPWSESASMSPGNDRPHIQLTFAAASPCSGTPAPGNTITSSTSVCPGVDFSLSLQNATTGTGVSYQWQKSANGTSGWTAIGTNASSLTTSQTAAAYYRCRVTCGSNTGDSEPVLVNMATPADAFFFEGFECGHTSGAAIANSWVQRAVSGTSNWIALNGTGTNGRGPNSGSWSAYLQYNNNRWFIRPIDPLTAGNQYKVSLYVKQNYHDGNNTTIAVAYGTGNQASDMVNIVVPEQAITGTNYQKIEGTFTSPGNGTYYIGIKGKTSNHSSFWYLSVDDIKIEALAVPACQAPTGLAVNDITSETALVEWQAPTPDPDSGYDWEIRTSGAAGSGATGRHSFGSTSGLSAPAVSLSSNTNYTVYVRSKCTSENSSWVSAAFKTLPGENELPDGYCWPTQQMACFMGDKITRVQFESIDHTDSECTSDPHGKKDFTGLSPAQVFRGSSYALSVTVENNIASGTEYLRAWIDFNRDGIFQPGESIDLGMGTGNTVLTQPIAIPETATPGLTRMRIMYRRTNTLAAGDACHSYGSYRGQVKDYAIKLLVPPVPSNDNPCTAAGLPIFPVGPTLSEYTTLGATNGSIPALSCAAGSVADVWFTTTLPAGGIGSLAVNVTGGTAGNLAGAIYTSSDNTCSGTFTEVSGSCDNDGGPGTAPWFANGNLSPGQPVWIRIAMTGSGEARGTFNIGLSEGQVWTGINNNTFSNASNWLYRDNAPDASTTIVVPASATVQPEVSSNASVRSICFVNSGGEASLIVNAGSILRIGENSTHAAPGFITGDGGKGFIAGQGEFRPEGQLVRLLSPLRASVRVIQLGTATTLESNGNLTIDNAILVSGNFGGSLYGHVEGDVTYLRTRNAGQYQYSYFSSPVNGATGNALVSQSGSIQAAYTYNAATTQPASNTDPLAGWIRINAATPLQAGKGYISQRVATARFTGTVNEDASYSVSLLNASSNKYNLVGNPYTSPIAIGPASLPNSFCNTNQANLAGQSLYFWDDSGDERGPYSAEGYMVYNATTDQFISSGTTSHSPASLPKVVAAGQGFFVNTINGTNLIFNESQRRVADNSTFYEAPALPFVKVRMTNAGQAISELLVGFSELASDGFEELYDAGFMQGNPSVGLYALVEGKKILADIMGSFNASKTVELGMLNTLPGTAYISLETIRNFDPSAQVILEDRATGVFHDLSAGKAYVFEHDPAQDAGSRFLLHFRAPVQTAAEPACAGTSNGTLRISNPNALDLSVQLQDQSGETRIAVVAANSEHLLDQLAAGAYTMKGQYANQPGFSMPVLIETGVQTAAFSASAETVSLAEAIIAFDAGIQDASVTVSWDFGDGIFLQYDPRPAHAYLQPGIYTVRLTLSNGKCSASAEKTITVTDVVSSAAIVSGTDHCILYPNPAGETVNLLIDLRQPEKELLVSVYDAGGRMVLNKRAQDVASGSVIGLPVSSLSNGVYLVTVQGRYFHGTERLTILH